MVQVLCKQCHQEFYAKPSWLSKGWGVYCSNNCRYTANRKGEVVVCHGCGVGTYKQPKALTRSKSGHFFCGKSCQTKWRNQVFIKTKHPNWKGGRTTYRALMVEHNIKAECTLCKITDKRVLAVHHIDHNRANNKIENLAWLCHNCHHLVHHDPEEQAKFMAIIV